MLSARQSPALSAFRVRTGAAARALRLDVARYAQQAVLTANVEEARHRVLLSRDGKALVQARFAGGTTNEISPAFFCRRRDPLERVRSGQAGAPR